MNENLPFVRFEDLPEDQARLVDQLCAQFELDLQANKARSFDAYLEQIPAHITRIAITELQRVKDSWNTLCQGENDNTVTERRTTANASIRSSTLSSSEPQSREIFRPDVEYQQLIEIGRGGMGIVFRARDVELNRDVALKFLHPDAIEADHRLARFMREARLISSLNHPNICTIHALKRWKQFPYLVLEWIEGRSIRDFIGCADHTKVIGWFIQICQALDYAHQQQIVHRDIKPENILVRSDGIVKLLDFGLARLVEGSLSNDDLHSSLNRMLGTIPYMSPEQIAGDRASKQSDLFSMGVLMYEMLTGIHPFRGRTNIETLEAIEVCDPLPLNRLNQQLSHGMNEVVMALLQLDPTLRPSAAELSQRLTDAGIHSKCSSFQFNAS